MYLRWIAEPFVWLSIFAVLIASGMGMLPKIAINQPSYRSLTKYSIFLLESGTVYCLRQYDRLKDDPPPPQIDQSDLNVFAWTRIIGNNAKMWLYLSLLAGILTVSLFFMMMVIRSRLLATITLLKESSK